jgi:rubredoxin
VGSTATIPSFFSHKPAWQDNARCQNLPRAMARHAIFSAATVAIYDESIGEPDTGIPMSTDFDALPATWCCRDCGAKPDHIEQII